MLCWALGCACRCSLSCCCVVLGAWLCLPMQSESVRANAGPGVGAGVPVHPGTGGRPRRGRVRGAAHGHPRAGAHRGHSSRWGHSQLRVHVAVHRLLSPGVLPGVGAVHFQQLYEKRGGSHSVCRTARIPRLPSAAAAGWGPGQSCCRGSLACVVWSASLLRGLASDCSCDRARGIAPPPPGFCPGVLAP